MRIFSVIGILSFLYASNALEIEPEQAIVLDEPSAVVLVANET